MRALEDGNPGEYCTEGEEEASPWHGVRRIEVSDSPDGSDGGEGEQYELEEHVFYPLCFQAFWRSGSAAVTNSATLAQQSANC